MSRLSAINLASKLATFSEHWAPWTVGTFNGDDVMVVKIEGEFMWHSHAETDDFFLVLSGEVGIMPSNSFKARGGRIAAAVLFAQVCYALCITLASTAHADLATAALWSRTCAATPFDIEAIDEAAVSFGLQRSEADLAPASFSWIQRLETQRKWFDFDHLVTVARGKTTSFLGEKASVEECMISSRFPLDPAAFLKTTFKYEPPEPAPIIVDGKEIPGARLGPDRVDPAIISVRGERLVFLLLWLHDFRDGKIQPHAVAIIRSETLRSIVESGQNSPNGTHQE